MFRNRISGYYQDVEAREEVRTPPGFTAVPVSQLPQEAQYSAQLNQSIYQLAFAKAQADSQAASIDPDWFTT